MNESKLDSTVLDDDVYIPGFAEVRKLGQLTEGMEVVYVQMCALIWTRNDLIKSDGRQEKSSNRSSITNQRSGSLSNGPIFNLKFANINFLAFANKAAAHGEIFLTLEDTLREIGFHDN